MSHPLTSRRSAVADPAVRYAVAVLCSATLAAADSGAATPEGDGWKAPPEGNVRAGLPPDRHLRDFVIDHWTVDDGVPTGTLNNVYQTADGYLWITSYDGLIRFDGVDFTTFDQRRVAELPSNGFYELVEDADHGLWIGTQSAGVVVYRGGRFEQLAGAAELRVTIRALWLDADGTAWIGTGGSGVYRYREGQLTAVDHPALRDVSVRDVLRDGDGTMWFATEGNGLVSLRAGGYSVLMTGGGLASDAVTSLCRDGDVLWVGTEEGLSKIDRDRVQSVGSLDGAQIYRLNQDDYGNLWIAAEQGLIRRNAISGDFERLGSFEGRSVRGVSAIAFDREGAVWAVSYADGLFRLKEGKLKTFDTRSGLASARVNSLYQTASGDVLVGGDEGRINVVRGDSVGAEPGLGPDVRVRGFLEDHRGRRWIVSYAGLLKIEDGEQTWYTTGNGLPTNQVRSVFEDSSGRIWIGTRNAGLIEALEDGRFRAMDKSSGLSSSFILSIEETPDGELMLGSQQGLDILHPDGSIVHYGADDGIPGAIVFSARVDGDGAVWLATNGGLGRLAGGEIRALTIDHGLPAVSIFDYAEDAAGSVWLSSDLGVVRLLKQQLVEHMDGVREGIDAVVYDDRDGMSSRSCTGAAKILEASDGRLWFPTLDGVSVLDPEDISFNPVEPPVDIQGLFVDGKKVDLTGRDDKPELEPGSKEFLFRFTALSLLAPSRVEIRYRLVGFDDGWIVAGAERAVRYTNLAHGDYAFRVIAANDDGVWNEQGATLAFRVEPFFYHTPLFLAAAVLLATALIRGGTLWRLKRVRARNARLEEIIAEQGRTQEANRRLIDELEAKNAELERFIYTVSHDLKSPLVTIRGFTGMVERDLANGRFERLEHDLERIDSAAVRMARLLDELLELSRVGRVTGPPEELALADLAREAVKQASAGSGDLRAEIVIAADLPRVAGDRPRLIEVFLNLIENAQRFIGEQPAPRIEVGVRRGEAEPVIYVRDNGSGIEPKYHDRVFGLFERLDPRTEGTGVGLTLVRRIVEVHGGRIWVESEGAGRGSTFCFTLPSAGGARRR